MCQSRDGEKGDLGSDGEISSHEGKRLTAPISFTLDLCDRNFNSSSLRAEMLAEEKDLARFLSS